MILFLFCWCQMSKPVGALCSCCICWARAKPLCQVLKARVQVLFSRCPRAMKAVRCIALCSERIWNRHVDLCAISQSVRCPDYFYWSCFAMLCHVVSCCVNLRLMYSAVCKAIVRKWKTWRKAGALVLSSHVQSFPVSPVIVMSSHSVIAKALQLQGVHTHWSFVCIIL